MSTHWSFVCVSHEPPIHSEHSLNHGDDELATLWRRRAELAAMPDDAELQDAYLNGHAQFLRNHRACEIVLRSEYGDVKDPATMDVKPAHHCRTCTCGSQGGAT